jgi:hypothetical protein
VSAAGTQVGVDLAGDVALGLDQFPYVPGSGTTQNEVSVFARLPLGPGEHLNTGPHTDSVRGLAVHLIDQLL